MKLDDFTGADKRMPSHHYLDKSHHQGMQLASKLLMNKSELMHRWFLASANDDKFD